MTRHDSHDQNGHLSPSEPSSAPPNGPPPAGFIEKIRSRSASDAMPFRLIGAHDALSAALGEEAGFDGIWAGSLEVSASHAVPDNGKLVVHEMVERVTEMAWSVERPVLVDLDNGLDDLPRTVAKMEGAGSAGIALEDKALPKFNSLREANHQLQEVSAFSAELRLALASRDDERFAVVARVEALAAGQSVEDAVIRARAYADAGADAVIVHSRSSTGLDVLEVVERLPSSIIIGVIPTRFYRLSAESLRRAGVAFVIYANHGIRAEVEALRTVFRAIWTRGSSESVERTIAPVEDVFYLQERARPWMQAGIAFSPRELPYREPPAGYGEGSSP